MVNELKKVSLISQPNSQYNTYSWSPTSHILAIIPVLLFIYYTTYDLYVYLYAKINELKAKNIPIERIIIHENGWIQDDGDYQLRRYIRHYWEFVFIMSAFVILGKIVKKFLCSEKNQKPYIYLQVVIGTIYVVICHGIGSFYTFFFMILYYQFIKLFRNNRFFMPLLWIVTIVQLYTNHVYEGYKFAWIFGPDHSINQLYDQYAIQWEIIFNMTILRIISYGSDYHQALKKKKIQTKEEHFNKCIDCVGDQTCLRYRQDTHLDLKEYNFLNFYCYLVFYPIYLAGPPLTFNAWFSQINQYKSQVTLKSFVVFYSLCKPINVCKLIIVAFIHIVPAWAIFTVEKNSHIWVEFPLDKILYLSFDCLLFIWLKFNSFWKSFRMISLWEGVDCPENMNRCICNNYCFEGFWRSWHRGFNQWLIRYIYIPLGGAKWAFLNIWVVFTYVALWHEPSSDLVIWAWFICLCIIPEKGVKQYLSTKKFEKLWKKDYWRWICMFTGGLFINLMVFANLIGYGGGQVIVSTLIEKVSSYEGVIQAILQYILYSFVAGFMFMLRDNEAHNDVVHIQNQIKLKKSQDKGFNPEYLYKKLIKLKNY